MRSILAALTLGAALSLTASAAFSADAFDLFDRQAMQTTPSVTVQPMFTSDVVAGPTAPLPWWFYWHEQNRGR